MAAEHAEHAAHKAGHGLTRKVGPLPLWMWIVVVGGAIGIYLRYRSSSSSSSSAPNPNAVDPNSPMGLTFGQEAQDQANGIDPLTGMTYAQEQAQAAGSQYAGGGGGVVSGGGSGTSTTGLDSGSLAAISQLDGDIQALSGNLASSSYLTDQQPAQQAQPAPTFGQEISDVVGGITALKAAGLVGSSAPATVTKRPQPNLRGKGSVRAPSGPTKPSAPKGYTAIGLGAGNWEFRPTTQTKVVNRPKKPIKPAPKVGHGGGTVKLGGKRR